MKTLNRLVVCCASGLLFVTAAAAGQQTTRAVVRAPHDRQNAPGFRLADASGKKMQLSDFRGKPVLVNMWATGCGGCVQELPTFVRLDGAYKDQGLAVVGVSMDIMYEGLASAKDAWARVNPFAEAHDMKYTILMDDGRVANAFEVNALPATYLIDRHGRIAATYVGIVDPADLEANIKTIMAERE
ncbi:MAG TPA: TlpA disulfide reductase family protein [Vicinamibacterales bacterium]|nr:TlpA disulfide reductase family protein [Vicinamibacterales bacterium]